MEDVIEYDFITDPEWISEAVDFTEVGLQLNFRKLSALCKLCTLPGRINITLTSGTASKTEHNNAPTQTTTSNNEEVICSSLLSNVDLSELPTDVDSDYNSKDSLSVAPRTPTKKGRPVRRTESVIAREIRRQQEREKEVQQERALARSNSQRRQLSRCKNIELTNTDNTANVQEEKMEEIHEEKTESVPNERSEIPSEKTQTCDTLSQKLPLNGLEVNVCQNNNVANLTEKTLSFLPSPENSHSPKVSSSHEEKTNLPSSLPSSPSTKIKRQAPRPEDNHDSSTHQTQKSDPAGALWKKAVSTVTNKELIKQNMTAIKPKKSDEKPVSRRQMLRNKLYKSVTFSDENQIAANRNAITSSSIDLSTHSRSTFVSKLDQSAKDTQYSGYTADSPDRSMERIEKEIQQLREREKELRRANSRSKADYYLYYRKQHNRVASQV